MRTESENHSKLKLYAKEILKGMGYQDSEIFEEYRWVVPCSKVQEFKVDVAGIREKEKVAIEVGATQPDKLLILDLFWDKVIHLPYGVASQLDGVAFTLADKNAEIENLKKLLKESEQKLSVEVDIACLIDNMLSATLCRERPSGVYTLDRKHLMLFLLWRTIEHEIVHEDLPPDVNKSVNVLEDWLRGNWGALADKILGR